MSHDTQRPTEINHSDDGLTSEYLRQEPEDRCKDDTRFGPLVDLLNAHDAPEIDYFSPEVQKIIDDLRRLNEPLAVEQPKEYRIEPFSAKIDADLKSFKEKVKEVVHDVRTEVGKVFCKTITVPFSPIGDHTVQQVTGVDQFSNWGRTIDFRASYTLIIRSIEGVQKVVRWARSQNRRVRVAGFRHSWSDIFGKNGDIIIMFLPYDTLVELPYKTPSADWKTELSGVTSVSRVAGRSAPAGHAFYKIMAGTTNDQFRQWCFDNKKYCLPLSVIMVEITFGGSNAPICHGSGLSTKTLSDIVVEVEYVDAKGELRVINDPNELRAASGAFGLLGVVVSLTLQLDDMAVTDMMPVKLPIPLAIPPPKGFAIPYEVQKIMEKYNITQEQLDIAQQNFENRCKNDYYLEWFWFPYQDDCWVNTWSKRPYTSKDVDVKAYPGDGLLDGVKSQQSITDRSQAIRTFQSEALHFRRGIQNFRCWDIEWEIPIPKINGQPNFELIQRAWWDGISLMYSRKDAPVRVALELRLTGGSDVLAPQRGNDYTCSIEVLSTLITPKDSMTTSTKPTCSSMGKVASRAS